MNLDIQFRLKSNPLNIEYLHRNSYWYKILNRDPSKINEFMNNVKAYYKLRPVDKVNKAIDSLEMLGNLLNALK